MSGADLDRHYALVRTALVAMLEAEPSLKSLGKDGDAAHLSRLILRLGWAAEHGDNVD